MALRLRLPDGAAAEPPDALPDIDVSALAGARVTVRSAVRDGGAALRTLCVAAPSDRWAPGAEALVLDRAAGLVRAALPGAVGRWEAGAIQPYSAESPRFEQRFEGVAQGGGAALAVRGRHLLGFAGEDRAAVLCSVVCWEPAGAEDARCEALVGGASLEGALVAPPPPGLVVRGVVLAVEQPVAAGAVCAVLGAVGVAVLLARRPRPRPWR